jgi:hypothetical protein
LIRKHRQRSLPKREVSALFYTTAGESNHPISF